MEEEEKKKKKALPELDGTVDAPQETEGKMSGIVPVAKQVLRDVAGASDEDVEAVLPIATRSTKAQAEGEPDPLLDQKRDIALAGDNVEGLFRQKQSEGEDMEAYTGALLSILIPALAGVALGGKRGALHALKGAGEFEVKRREEERQNRADQERADITATNQLMRDQLNFERQRMRDERLEEGRDRRAGARNDAMSIEQSVKKVGAEEAERLRVRDVADRKKALDAEEPFLARGESIVEEARKILKGKWGVTKTLEGELVPGSDVAQLQARITRWAFDVIRSQESRPSDFDIKGFLKTIQGPAFLTSGDAAVKFLEQSVGDMREAREIRIRQLEGRATEKEVAKLRAREKAAQSNAGFERALLAAKRGNIPKQVIFERLNKAGYDIDMEDVELAMKTARAFQGEE